MTLRRAQSVNSLRRQRSRRQTERGAIQHHFGRTRDKRSDNGRTPGQRGGDEEPNFLRIPRSQGDHCAGRKIILQQLQRLRIGVRGTVFAGLQSRVRADEKERTVIAPFVGHARLVADGMEPRGDVPERRAERAVG